MTLILRKCWSNGSSSNGFHYGNVGDRVTAPFWDSEPKCGNGLHGLKNGIGDWTLLNGYDWLIIDADDQIVDIDNKKCKFNTGVILFRGSEGELEKTDFCHEMAANSDSAYNWAKYIGNKDVMISRIDNSEDAYCWAQNIGNQDVMANRINDSRNAYYWAKNIGNQSLMKSRIKDYIWITLWNKSFPDNKI